MVTKIGTKAPNLKISNWVQGLPTNIDKEKDNVILVEVFQVNCPGFFYMEFLKQLTFTTNIVKMG